MTLSNRQTTSPVIGRVLASALLLCCGSLSACGPTHKDEQVHVAAPSGPSATDTRIIDSGQRVAKAIEQLQRAQAVQVADAGKQIPPAVDPAAAPAPLRMAVTWEDWNGPLESAVRGIAQRIGYRVRVSGVPPAVPADVHVDAHATPAIQILEDLGLQAGARATVRIDAPSSMIYLYYSPPSMGVK